MAFDLLDALKNVPAADTGKEQIEYIPLDQIDPDPDNFYSLDGLEELAGNIETIGLQQPLRLRPSQGGRYTLISGHRRRAAILLIRDGGSEQFAQGVPSIVERGESSPALVKLKLLMANKDTRKMTSADQNRQAAELEDTLRQLSDEGFEFPGRLRDWVAELSGLSRSKLARLKVIRDKLAPDLKAAYYDTNQLDETAAYELARLDLSTQRWAMDVYTSTHHGSASMASWWPKQFDDDRKRFEQLQCQMADGGPCCYQRELMEHLYRKGYRGYEGCASGCCQTCREMEHCSNVCPRMKKEQEKLRAKNRQAKRDERAQKLAVEDARKREIEHFWFRFGQAMRRAGLDEVALMEATGRDRYCNQLFPYNTTAELRSQLLDGEGSARPDTYLPADRSMDLEQGRRLIAVADALDCSLDYLLQRTDVPEVNRGAEENGGRPQGSPLQDDNETPDGAPKWRTGTPVGEGWFAVKIRFFKTEMAQPRVYWFDGEGWLRDRERCLPIDRDFTIVRWIPLPETEEDE